MNNIKFERNSFQVYYQMTYIVTKHTSSRGLFFFIKKNILQHQQLVKSLAELLEAFQIPSSVMTFAVICK